MNQKIEARFKTLSQRVRVPNIQGPWSQQNRLRFLGPESLNIGCLEPVDFTMPGRYIEHNLFEDLLRHEDEAL